jgi:MoaA/NifB/PqqE/SkfB family radical SAM enzyme
VAPQFIKNALKAILPKGIIAFKRKRALKRQIKERLIKREKLVFEVFLADHCNLNCQCCGTFSPLDGKKFCDAEKLEKDFKRISELADGRIEFVRLLGGEPLLHPDLLRILDIAGKYFSKTDLVLVTNGILLDKQPAEFWESCKRNHVRISITKYPIHLPFKKIEKTGKEYGVAVGYFNDKNVVKTSIKFTMNTAGSANPEESFKLCHAANACTMLDDGKIYPCGRIARIEYFNKHFKTDLKVYDKDYMDIYKANNLNEILEFLCKPVPFCRYCNPDKYVHDIAWAVSKKEISEWV